MRNTNYNRINTVLCAKSFYIHVLFHSLFAITDALLKSLKVIWWLVATIFKQL